MVKSWIKSKFEVLFVILSFGFWGWIVVSVIGLIICSFFAVVGWALITVISIFTVVNITGFFSYAGIGFAVCVLATVFSKD